MRHVGVNVYLWGERDRDRFLTDCLGPTARALRHRGAADWFWFDRFDARGPHVFALFTTRSENGEVTECLRTTIADYLPAHPSTSQLGPEELLQRHTGCRGVALCAADNLPGLATNNSFELFEHKTTGYPFFLAGGRAAGGELWRLLETAALWVINGLSSGPDAAARMAIQWIASVDHQLRLAGADAMGYWHHHLVTLVHSFKNRLEPGNPEVVSRVEQAIGERNRRLFAAAWVQVEHNGPCWESLPRLVAIALSGMDTDPLGPWALQREIDHFTLKQLGLSHPLHIPLVLFAWHRNLSLQC